MSKKRSQDGSFYQQIVLPVDDFQVAPWSPGDVEQGDPLTQVHILYSFTHIEELYAAFKEHHGFPMIAIRLKSKAAVDSLIAALIKHRDEVWPAPQDNDE